MLIKHPTLSIVAIITFGLGIGLTTTVFSIVNGAFFKGLPFEEGDRIVILSNTNPSRNLRAMAVSVHDFAVWQERQTVLESLGCFAVAAMNLASGGGQPERFTSGQVSANAPDILRVKPVLGRAFRAGEDRPGAEPVIIIGYNIWRDRYAFRGRENLHRPNQLDAICLSGRCELCSVLRAVAADAANTHPAQENGARAVCPSF